MTDEICSISIIDKFTGYLRTELAYALTLPLLGFKCTWYKIKFRDKNEKGKDFHFL